VAANIRARIEFHSGAGRSGEGQRLAGAAHGVISNTNPQPLGLSTVQFRSPPTSVVP